MKAERGDEFEKKTALQKRSRADRVCVRPRNHHCDISAVQGDDADTRDCADFARLCVCEMSVIFRRGFSDCCCSEKSENAQRFT